MAFPQYFSIFPHIFLLILLISHPTFQQPSPKLNTIDHNVLIEIKNNLIDLFPSSLFSSWNFSSPNPCSSFEGLTCTLTSPSTLRVDTLELGSGHFGTLGLAGSLPESITLLTELTQLILNPGLVTGPIPARIGRLVNLKVLSLPHNRLTGPIPPSLSLLRGLHTLDLGFNQLTGSIPPALLTELTQLRVLILANNRLTGELPESTHQSQLLHLDLKANHFVGPIPPTLPLNLRYMSLSQNHMWGPIFNGPLKSLSQLEYLDLSQNHFSGSLPLSLINPSLSTLLLHHNNFSGPISGPFSSQISPDFPQLFQEDSIIDLSYNNFSGQIPEIFSGAATIYLNNNQFSGPVPQAFIDGLQEDAIARSLEALFEVQPSMIFNHLKTQIAGLFSSSYKYSSIVSSPKILK